MPCHQLPCIWQVPLKKYNDWENILERCLYVYCSILEEINTEIHHQQSQSSQSYQHFGIPLLIHSNSQQNSGDFRFFSLVQALIESLCPIFIREEELLCMSVLGKRQKVNDIKSDLIGKGNNKLRTD